MPGAVVGSSAVWPVRVCPLATVSRLVPSRLISSSSPACEEEDSPRTATMAATPMAMPSADRAARSVRVRRPTTDRRARSAGRSRCVISAAVVVTGVPAPDSVAGGVGDDASIEHLDRARHARGDVLVVGDHHDRGAGGVQVVEQVEDGLPGRLVEVAGGLVGQDDRRGVRPGRERSRPAAAVRRTVGSAARAAGPPARPRPAPAAARSRRCRIGMPA